MKAGVASNDTTPVWLVTALVCNSFGCREHVPQFSRKH